MTDQKRQEVYSKLLDLKGETYKAGREKIARDILTKITATSNKYELSKPVKELGKHPVSQAILDAFKQAGAENPNGLMFYSLDYLVSGDENKALNGGQIPNVDLLAPEDHVSIQKDNNGRWRIAVAGKEGIRFQGFLFPPLAAATEAPKEEQRTIVTADRTETGFFNTSGQLTQGERKYKDGRTEKGTFKENALFTGEFTQDGQTYRMTEGTVLRTNTAPAPAAVEEDVANPIDTGTTTETDTDNPIETVGSQEAMTDQQAQVLLQKKFPTATNIQILAVEDTLISAQMDLADGDQYIGEFDKTTGKFLDGTVTNPNQSTKEYKDGHPSTIAVQKPAPVETQNPENPAPQANTDTPQPENVPADTDVAITSKDETDLPIETNTEETSGDTDVPAPTLDRATVEKNWEEMKKNLDNSEGGSFEWEQIKDKALQINTPPFYADGDALYINDGLFSDTLVGVITNPESNASPLVEILNQKWALDRSE